MKKIFGSGLLITWLFVFPGTSAFGQEPETWYTYLNEPFGFAIDFPTAPDSMVQTVNTTAGKITMHMFQLDCSADDSTNNIYYAVNYSQYPDSFNYNMLNLDTFYRNSIKGMLANLNSELMEEKVIDFNGNEGRELRVDFQAGLAIITEKIVLIDNRYYILMVITETEKDLNPAIRRFIDSFRLLPKNLPNSDS